MKAVKARRRRRAESNGSRRPSKTRRRVGGSDAKYRIDAPPDCTIDDVRNRMVEFLPRLRRFTGLLTHDLDQSEDLVQETYARALTHLDQWQRGTRLDSWMFRIAQNLWIDHARAEKVRGDVIDVEIIDKFFSCDGRIVVESRLVLQEVRKGMARLSTDQRNVIRLVCVFGMSYEEAGKILNLPSGTVMSRLARARAALHESMQRAHLRKMPGDDGYGQTRERK
jgi:RNA polymerase sigma-70 factor, ECF subfamily